MSSDKLPLTEPVPLYPAYNPGSYQMQSADGQHAFIPPPEARMEPENRRNEDNRENGEKLEDGDDLLPGTGPGGIPDKHFNVS